MATKKQPSAIKARVLVDGSFGKNNDVVEIPADELEKALASGQIDTDADAVAYALTLTQE